MRHGQGTASASFGLDGNHRTEDFEPNAAVE